jgi:hypothetical protein
MIFSLQQPALGAQDAINVTLDTSTITTRNALVRPSTNSDGNISPAYIPAANPERVPMRE